MSLLITAATEQELLPIRNRLRADSGASFAVTGVGAMATCYNLTRILCGHCYDLVVNVGIAGAYSTSQSLGGAVVVARESFDGIGIESADGRIGALPDELLAMPILRCPYLHEFAALRALSAVDGLTVGLITERDATVGSRRALHCADIETMEGAAFFYVCTMENVRFIELRGLSNHVGVRNKERWKAPQALESVANVLADMIA